MACCLVQSRRSSEAYGLRNARVVGGGGTPCRRHCCPEWRGAAPGVPDAQGLVSHLRDVGVCPGAMGKSLKATWGGVSVTRPDFYFEKVIWLQCGWRMELDMSRRRSQSGPAGMGRIPGTLVTLDPEVTVQMGK